MRSESEMYDLILEVAKEDDRIRGVILNGSRANPNAPTDIFQDYDIVYLVTDIESFKADTTWIDQFGARIMMQLPEDMDDPPPSSDDHYAYLTQFADGNRIDLGLSLVSQLDEMERDSQSVLLLDKDSTIKPFPPPSDADYLPKPPTAKAFADCCNEFWWVSTYVAKGLWREEITYAKSMYEEFVRSQLMKMLNWYIGVKTEFSSNPGKLGKYFKQYLEPELWGMLMATYADAGYDHTWDALEQMCRLFQITSQSISKHFGFEYPLEDDQKVSAHLKHVRSLPKDSKDMYE